MPRKILAARIAPLFATAIALLPAAPAAAATTSASAVPSVQKHGPVLLFRLPALRPERVVRARLVVGSRRQTVSVEKVRRALAKRRRVLRLRSYVGSRRARLSVRMARSSRKRPTTSITSGPTGTVTSDSAAFTLSSSSATATFECRLDNAAWAPCTARETLTGLANGSHTFSARARSGQLADDTPATRTWTVAKPVDAPATATPTAPAPTQPAPSGGHTDAPMPVGGAEMLRDEFTGPDGIITNAYAYWTPTDTLGYRSSIWENETATLYRRANTGWSGVPNGGGDVDRTSSQVNGSEMFRMWTQRADFGNVLVTMKLRHEAYTNGSTADWPAKSWDGLKLWLRRGGRTGSHNLYTVEVNRRQGNVMLQKKCAGSDQYTILAQTATNSMPALGDQWETVGGSVRTNADGTVSLQLIREGRVVLEATDDGDGGCAPITAAGRVGIRGDNTQFGVDDFVVARI